MPSRRYEVLGVAVDALRLDDARDVAEHMIRQGAFGYLVFCTVSTILSAHDDPSVAAAVAEARLVAPDGMPLVWLGRRRGLAVERVYGPDFMRFFVKATGGKYRHFFYGGGPGVAERLVGSLRERVPELRVAGSLTPPARLDPLAPPPEQLRVINEAEPDIVWVGLGHPKQELFMYHNRDAIRAPVMAGVGAAFDYVSGAKAEAPPWMRSSGLQWFHRLLTEPRRLWRRYLIGNARFLILCLHRRCVDAAKGRRRGQPPVT